VHGRQYNDKGGQGLGKIKEKLCLSESKCACSKCGRKKVVRTQVEKSKNSHRTGNCGSSGWPRLCKVLRKCVVCYCCNYCFIWYKV